jgi:hypothetical protein
MKRTTLGVGYSRPVPDLVRRPRTHRFLLRDEAELATLPPYCRAGHGRTGTLSPSTLLGNALRGCVLGLPFPERRSRYSSTRTLWRLMAGNTEVASPSVPLPRRHRSCSTEGREPRAFRSEEFTEGRRPRCRPGGRHEGRRRLATLCGLCRRLSPAAAGWRWSSSPDLPKDQGDWSINRQVALTRKPDQLHHRLQGAMVTEIPIEGRDTVSLKGEDRPGTRIPECSAAGTSSSPRTAPLRLNSRRG